MHTHIYNQYSKSPRLAILSPVPDCGKSTVLDLLGATVWNPKRLVDPTVASTFRLAGNHTLLLDEVDNMSLVKSMKAILNDGHSFGGTVTRAGPDGEVISYPVYGPVALTGIGKLPVTLMSRSLVIQMHRSPKKMEKFDAQAANSVPDFSYWASKVNLNSDPQMPAQIIGRDADKWRPLLAIADTFGQECSIMARNVALKFINESNTPDIKESVLRDIEKVFNKLKAKVIITEILHQLLVEDKDGEYEVDYVEKKITKRAIGNYLADFQIRSKPYRHRGGPPKKCWFREDFEEMWERYPFKR
jgi:hypothetical protein